MQISIIQSLLVTQLLVRATFDPRDRNDVMLGNKMMKIWKLFHHQRIPRPKISLVANLHNPIYLCQPVIGQRHQGLQGRHTGGLNL